MTLGSSIHSAFLIIIYTTFPLLDFTFIIVISATCRISIIIARFVKKNQKYISVNNRSLRHGVLVLLLLL